MDVVIKNLNPFGKYQKLLLIIIGIPSAFSAITIYSTIFTAAKPNFYCESFYEGNSLNKTKTSEETCDIWYNSTKYNTTYTCKYSTEYYGKTIITDWSLICDRKALAGLTQTFYMIGSFSAIFSGYFGDHYGRKKSTVGFLCLMSATMVIAQIFMLDAVKIGVTAKYVIYCISQLLIGVFVNCIYVSGYILLLEQTTHDYHTLFSNIKLLFYVIGELLIVLLAYFVRDWHIINWIITGVTVLVTFVVWFLIDESVRWHASQGNFIEASRILQKMAKLNKKNVNLELFTKLDINNNESFFKILNSKIAPEENKSLNPENGKEYGTVTKQALQFFKPMTIKQMIIEIFSRKQFFKTIFIAYVWLSTTLLYYGTSLGISSVDSINPYVLYVFQSIAELIGYWLCLFNDKFGRRKMTIFFLLFASMMCLIVSLIPRNKDPNNKSKVILDAAVVISLISIGKCMVSGAFNTLYVYTAELYPTSVRNFALLSISSVGRMGSLISPQINLLGDIVWKHSPYLVFSGSAFIATIFVYILPETL